MEEENKPPKRGNVFNQLAILSELAENVNFESEKTSIIFEFKTPEFKRIYELVQKKANVIEDINTRQFNLKIGDVDFVFVNSD